METLDKYIVELENDLKIDRIGLEEKTLLVAGIKGKWLSRNTIHKRELNKYQELMDEAKSKLVKEFEKNSDISYNKATIEKIVMENEIIRKIKKNIDSERLVIEFCDKAVTITSSMTYDIKNIVEWSKLELT